MSQDWHRYHRIWTDPDGREWHARVDRMSMRCGACDLTRYLHVEPPGGRRYTFTLAPDADLDGVSDAELVRLVVDAGYEPTRVTRIP